MFTLQIANDQKYPELNQEIAATIKVVKPNASPCLRGGSTAIRIEARWKHWPCVFPQHGAGRKRLRKIELEPWQLEIVAKYPERLLRGLFHSDGCRLVNWASRPGWTGGTTTCATGSPMSRKISGRYSPTPLICWVLLGDSRGGTRSR
ncbi:hypothetical protein AB0F43_00935 [Kribbella sp. NPDC023972]|uniref:hypothetical protein n=1 Tax=Kribbella sp. NPDC023972 TaxID=3154795 RepID=UPI0033E6AC6D